MRKFVQGVLEIRSLKLGAIKAWSRGQGAWSRERGAIYPITIYEQEHEQEQQLEMIGG